MIRIEPLTEERAEETINLLNTIFPGEQEEPPSIAFLASLNPEPYKDLLAEMQIAPDLRYWLAIDDSGTVVGTVGLYCYRDKEEAFWVGYFCVRPLVRKKGIGTQLLQFIINESKNRKPSKKFLRLWTENDLLDAIRLYEKHGFKLVGEKPINEAGLKKLHYELKL